MGMVKLQPLTESNYDYDKTAQLITSRRRTCNPVVQIGRRERLAKYVTVREI